MRQVEDDQVKSFITNKLSSRRHLASHGAQICVRFGLAVPQPHLCVLCSIKNITNNRKLYS
jgi:hypothetical protein